MFLDRKAQYCQDVPGSMAQSQNCSTSCCGSQQAGLEFIWKQLTQYCKSPESGLTLTSRLSLRLQRPGLREESTDQQDRIAQKTFRERTRAALRSKDSPFQAVLEQPNTHIQNNKQRRIQTDSTSQDYLKVDHRSHSNLLSLQEKTQMTVSQDHIYFSLNFVMNLEFGNSFQKQKVGRDAIWFSSPVPQ